MSAVMPMEPGAGQPTVWPIACQGIAKRYADKTVLRDLDLQVEPGAVLGLIGRNGAGKTTLIRILLGLEQPDEGRSFLFGEPSLSLSDGAKARLGYVPQQPDAFAWMRVGDMLDFVGRQYPRWDVAFVDRFLGRWQISRAGKLSKLSPGERQRVALIRALAVTPDLLVLDEPGSALDPVARRDMLREIVERAAESGTTVLFSTHIVSDLERVASRVVLLHEQRIIIDAQMDELADTHARLIVPGEAMDRVVARLPGEISRRRRADGSAALVIARKRGAEWPQIVHVPGVQQDALSLEDLFIEIAQ